MSRLGWAAFGIGSLLLQAPVYAATITVTGDSPRNSITVTIENARVDLVLEDLRNKYGFDVGGLQNASKGEPLSATMSGNLQSVLARLLRNWNHLIVSSPDNESGIAKVIILDSAYGAVPHKAGQTRADGTPPYKQPQALFCQSASNFDPLSACNVDPL